VLRLITFGGCFVRREDGSEVAVPRRRLALLAAIAAGDDRGVSRDRLLALLWPEQDEERGRAALSQALYALRRDLGDDAAIGGTADLRLDAERIRADRTDFQRYLATGRDAEAALLYHGPYLDGFHVKDAPDFERAVEEDRARFAVMAGAALERLAHDAAGRGEAAEAVRLWRARALIDPTDARVAQELMRALAAAGDRPAAIRHAEIYAELVRQDLEIDPDTAVYRLAEELKTRAGRTEKAETAGKADTASEAAAGTTASPAVPALPAAPSRPRWPWFAVAGLVATLIVGRFVLPIVRSFPSPFAHPAQRVLAVGRLDDYTPDSLARPLTDLLTTSLARIPGLGVVSSERMAELRSRPEAPTGTALLRLAGATEALEGALYRQPDGSYRLDLRRVRMEDGRADSSFTVLGKEVFALVDEASRRLLALYGVPNGNDGGSVTTSSLSALHLYQDGLARYYKGDGPGSYALFTAAVREDPRFAMAAYYAFLSSPSVETGRHWSDSARALAHDASLRERLLINLWTAQDRNDPVSIPLAESLTTLFPQEFDAQYARAYNQIYGEGDFLGAVTSARRALALDPDGWTGWTIKCHTCAAAAILELAYVSADSMDAAERVAREYVRRAPEDPAAWYILSTLLDERERYAEAAQAESMVVKYNTAHDPWIRIVARDIRSGRFAEADQALRAAIRTGTPAMRGEAYWALAQLERERGRPAAAVTAIAAWRAVSRQLGSALPYEAVYQAQVLCDAGRHREALALWDSVARLPDLRGGTGARGWTWAKGLSANALIALGDTARILALADSVRRRGAQSGFARDRRLHHHLEGLVWRARGEPRRALPEFREAVWSYTGGYTRTNYFLARTLMELGQPRDAATVLAAALHSELTASVQYITNTELHALLGEAWAQAGQRDSARVHLRIAAERWKDAEPEWTARRDSALALLRTLGS
jgi:DNA-binding SARP family transcriptional activator